MKLLVLAGGFGTRLQHAVSAVPKALAPVDNVPFLHFQIENWISQGVKSFSFLLHHQSQLIIEFLLNRKNNLLKGCEVEWLVEPEPMGTGGAVVYAVAHLNLTGNFLLTNADTWLGNGIKQIFYAASPAIAIVKVDDSGRYGCVLLDEHNNVKTFREKASNNSSCFINAGLCLLHSDLFRGWNQEPFSLEQRLFPFWAKNKMLKAVSLNTDFIDIGIPEDYFRFCRWIESGKMLKL